MLSIKYQIKFQSKDGVQYVSSIYEDNYTGDIIELKGAAHPFVTDEENNKDAMLPVRTQTGHLNVIDEKGDLVEQLASISATSHYIDLMRIGDDGENILVWQGFLSDEAYTQNWCEGIQEVNISLRSPLEVLKYIKTPVESFSSILSLQYIIYLVIIKKINEYAPRHIYDTIYLPNLQFSQNVIQNLAMYMVNFFSESEVKSADGTKKVIEGMSLYDILENFAKFFGWSVQERASSLYCNYFSALEDEWGPTYGDTYYAINYDGHSWRYMSPSLMRENIESLEYRDSGHKLGFLKGANKITINANINKIESNIFNGMNLPDLPYATDLTHVPKMIYGTFQTNPFYDYNWSLSWYNFLIVFGQDTPYNDYQRQFFVDMYYSKAKTLGEFTTSENFYYLAYHLKQHPSGSDFWGERQMYMPSDEEKNIPIGKQGFTFQHIDVMNERAYLCPFAFMVPYSLSAFDYKIEFTDHIKRRTGAFFCKYDSWRESEDKEHTSLSYKNALYCCMMPYIYINDSLLNPIFSMQSKNVFQAGEGFFHIEMNADFLSAFQTIQKPRDDKGFVYFTIQHGGQYWQSGNTWGNTFWPHQLFFNADGTIKTNRTIDTPVMGDGGFFIPAKNAQQGIVKITFYDNLNVQLSAYSSIIPTLGIRETKADFIDAWDMIINDLSVNFVSKQNIFTDDSEENTYVELINLNTDNSPEIDCKIASFNNNVDGYGFLRQQTGSSSYQPISTLVIPSYDETSKIYVTKQIRPEIHLAQRLCKYYEKARQWMQLTVKPLENSLPLIRFKYKGKEFAPVSEKRDWQENTSEIIITEIPKSYED